MRALALAAALLVLTTCPRRACAQTVRVANTGQLRQALTEAKPGQRITLLPGDYDGALYFAGLRGTAARPIVVTAANPERPPVIRGGGEGLHLVAVAHIELSHLVFERATAIGLHIEDREDGSSPSHHVTLRHISVRNIGGFGIDDGIKLSGVNDFLIEDCTLERWGPEGLGVNLIACNRGQVVNCTFDGKNAVKMGLQAKGGCLDVRVRNCSFRGIRDRGINVGGLTGLSFFRPEPQGYEAKDVLVEDCSFVGAEAPVALVGCDGAVVRRNAIYCPTKWVLRILQENTLPGFVPCRNGQFSQNVVVWRTDQLRDQFANVGDGTAPETFRFEENYWYCQDRPARSWPVGLPTPEKNRVYGQDPMFAAPETGDLRLGRSRELMRAAFLEAQARLRDSFLWGEEGALLALVAAFGCLCVLRAPGRVGPVGAHRLLFGKTAAPAPRRAHFVVALLVWLGLLTYAPLRNIAWQAPDRTTAFSTAPNASPGVGVRSGPTALDLCLLFAPVGFCGCAIVTLDRTGRREVRRAAVVWGIGCSLWFATLQVLLFSAPYSAASPTDVVMRLTGCLVGGLLWQAYGLTWVTWLRQRLPARRVGQPLDRLLAVYVSGLLLYSLLPLEFITRPGELSNKLRGEGVNLIPFRGGELGLASLLVGTLAFVPVGAWAATAWTGPRQPVRPVWLAMLPGLLFVVLFAGGQLVAWEGFFDTTQIVLGSLGVFLGATLMRVAGESLFRFTGQRLG
jgi:hypothetical protein